MTPSLLIEKGIISDAFPGILKTGDYSLENGSRARALAEELNGRLRTDPPLRAGELYLVAMLGGVSSALASAYMEDLRTLAEGISLKEILPPGSSEDSGASGSYDTEEGDRLNSLLDEAQSLFPTAAPIAPDSPAGLIEERIIRLCTLFLLDENPGCASLRLLWPSLKKSSPLMRSLPERCAAFLRSLPLPPGWDESLFHLLRKPAALYPDSLEKQVRFITDSPYYDRLRDKTPLLRALDLNNEENKIGCGGPGPVEGIDFSFIEDNSPHFSSDSDWMPRLILLAKNCYVWLSQLSEKYKREIRSLNDIPGEELGELARRGISGLWLIGLWERSPASRRIKRACGNPEAEASAYSLKNYAISEDLGGWEALQNLKERCLRRGIRLASDMVPNHTGMDSDWMVEHPEYFLSLPYSPYPNYRFSGENLSDDSRMEIYLEDGYYDRSDAAVVFLRRDTDSGKERYVYHGNDGTSMPWNDTAQLDFTNPDLREAVIRQIIEVAGHFPIIRFDAAMTLAMKHVQRLWYPRPGDGGAVPSRSEFGMSEKEFRKLMPEEFWREVVERVREELPHTLLLAEAFWMMEGYFVRNLGMHRVYNSAFMNLLKAEENKEYRRILKETLVSDPRILKRFVNFMNNPDEDTAVSQFGKGDKYFGVCTLLMTLPGLPMVGHGQFEGLSEKYGMEYRRPYFDEQPDEELLRRHEREIYPLMKQRLLFAGARRFHMFDYYNRSGINEDVYAFSNSREGYHALVLYNNSNTLTEGRIHRECPKIDGEGGKKQEKSLGEIFDLSESGYTLLFESRKRLWYIHRNRDILKKGLPVKLYGYQSKVFFPVEFREDDGERRLEKLILKIGERGVPDLNRALMFSELEPLIHMMRTFLSSRVIDTPVMSDLITQFSRDLNRVRRLLKSRRRPAAPEQTVLEGIIRPSFLSLTLSRPDDKRLFYMARFYSLWKEEKPSSAGDFHALWNRVLEDGDFAPWFGINSYRDILWFNKECMDQAFWWFSCLSSLEALARHAAPEGKEIMTGTAGMLTGVQKRIAESEYRVSQLLDRKEE